MFKVAFVALAVLFSTVVFGQSQEITTCRSPNGKVYRHYFGSQDKPGSGWGDDKISNGVITLVQLSDGNFDLLYVDIRNKPISVIQDGAKVVLLRGGPDDITLLTHYPESTTEIYSFFREKDGKVKYTVLTSRTGPDTFAPKSSVMVGDCSALNLKSLR